MLKEELIRGYKSGGYRISAPKTIISQPTNEKEILTTFKQNNLSSTDILTALYSQVGQINFLWQLYEDDSNTINSFKEDPWLKEHYFDNSYSWNAVKELLSGSLFVPPLEELLGRSNNYNAGYYVVAEHMKLDPNSFCPIDYHTRFTALLKIEENEIKDHVWLLDLEARELYDMNVTVEQYLNLAYQAKIFNGWQHVYVFKSKSEFYEIMKRFLPKILPHVDLNLTEFGII
ncbi:hypothetical protein [uncultured Psychroserpens sp.]|nr:hypothetical protein [uncultured Psychroserpens sp.]